MKTLLLLSSLALCACEPEVSKVPDSAGGIRIASDWSDAYLYTVEKDGHKFAVLIGSTGNALIHHPDCPCGKGKE